MKTTLGAIIGAIICFFTLKQCDTDKTSTRIITKTVSVPTYIEKVTSVNVPVTKIKYIKLYNTTTAYVHDTLDQLVEVTKYDTTKSVAVIPYQDSSVHILDSITLTGQITNFKRTVTVRERQPDTLTVTKEVTKYFRGIKYYVGMDSNFKNLFQPAFGFSYDSKKFQLSLGYRPVTKVVEARFFLPLLKF